MSPKSHHAAARLTPPNALGDIVAQNADALMIVDTSGTVCFANPATEQLFGRPLKDLIGSPFGYPLGSAQSAPLEIVRPDGFVSIVEMRIGPITWQNDTAYLIALHDVSEQAANERRLIEMQQFLRSTLDALDAQIAILDEHGVILAVNAAWQNLARSADADPYRSGVGYNFLQICEQAGESPLDGGIAAEVAAGVRAVLSGEQPDLRLEYSCAVGMQMLWYTLRVTRFFEHGLPRVVVAYDDITLRKQTERLDWQRREVLELIACSRPLTEVIDRLLQMIAEQYPLLGYAAFSLQNRTLYAWKRPNTDAGAAATFDHWASSPQTFSLPNSHPQAISVLPTLRLDPLIAAAAQQMEIEICWCVSLGVGGVLIGHRATLAPGDADRRFLELLAQLTTIAYEQHERTRQLDYQAHHDALTGLPNRALFEDRLVQAIETARRSRHMIAVLFIDLDRFKQVNDTLGHAIGDKLLVQLARRLESGVRAVDTLARRGGDEFMLVLTECSESAQVSIVAHRLLELLRLPFTIEGNELYVSASIGASIFPIDADSSDMLQRNADAAMYRAKTHFGSSFQFFDPEMNQAALERMYLENGLRRALERDELRLYYQPKINAAGQLCGAEALLRWQHPEEGLLLPGRFIAMAEELGLIIPIGEWVLREVCRQLALWQQAGMPQLTVAVNISALQLAQNGFLAHLAQVIHEFQIRPHTIELELTESMLMGDFVVVARLLAELRNLNLSLAIDDFGTGYSSLNYLRNLPIDVLKIDRSFIEEVDEPDSRNARAIVHTIVTLGHHLGAQVVAEGVARSGQFEFLRSIGCDQYQGFLISEPLTEAAFSQLLGERRVLDLS